MSRTLRLALVACFVGRLAAAGLAQAQRPLPSADTPVPRRPLPNAGAERRERPQAQPLRVNNVPPQLMQILQQWSAATKQILRLSGVQHRFVYDMVFNVEKRSSGHFYYESPGKGRIDIEPKKVNAGAVGNRRGKDGKPLALKPEKEERWICDGRMIMKLDVGQKQADMFRIPPQNQGANIMDGPLPFLFGMPPEKAIARYHMSLEPMPKGAPADQVWIKVIPRLKTDAANYKVATVILDKRIWLPSAVKMLNPAGTTETVYVFKDMQINPRNFVPWWKGGGDPFKPNLRNWKIVNKTPAKVQNPVAKAPVGKIRPVGAQAPAGGLQMPSLVGLPAREARDLLTKNGLKAEYRAGKSASRQNLLFVVYGQQPLAGTKISKDSPIVLTYFARPSTGSEK